MRRYRGHEPRQLAGVDDGAGGVVRVADEDQTRAVGDGREHGIEIVSVITQGDRHGRGARGADLQRIDLETAPREQHFVADGRCDLYQLLAQTHRSAAHRDVLGREIHVLGKAFPQVKIPVVGVAVDQIGGLEDRLADTGKWSVDGFVARDLDCARNCFAWCVRGKVGHFGAQSDAHLVRIGESVYSSPSAVTGTKTESGTLTEVQEACQSGRMGLTANELSPLPGTGGSNPLASARVDSSTVYN